MELRCRAESARNSSSSVDRVGAVRRIAHRSVTSLVRKSVVPRINGVIVKRGPAVRITYFSRSGTDFIKKSKSERSTKVESLYGIASSTRYRDGEVCCSACGRSVRRLWRLTFDFANRYRHFSLRMTAQRQGGDDDAVDRNTGRDFSEVL